MFLSTLSEEDYLFEWRRFCFLHQISKKEKKERGNQPNGVVAEKHSRFFVFSPNQEVWRVINTEMQPKKKKSCNHCRDEPDCARGQEEEMGPERQVY